MSILNILLELIFFIFSAFGVAYLSALITENYEFKADHPFLFYLTEQQNVLFSGVYQS